MSPGGYSPHLLPFSLHDTLKTNVPFGYPGIGCANLSVLPTLAPDQVGYLSGMTQRPQESSLVPDFGFIIKATTQEQPSGREAESRFLGEGASRWPDLPCSL